MRESNKWKPFNGPISRVNLFSFTLIVRKGKVETFIMRSWTWVKKREKIHHLKRNENKKGRKFEPNRNVTETWSFVSDAETRRKRVLSMENWITMFPHGGNLTDISFCRVNKIRKHVISSRVTCVPKWTVSLTILYLESSSRTAHADFRNEDAGYGSVPYTEK